MTEVEKLIEQLTSIGVLEIPKGSNAVTYIIEQAKEMEKEQKNNLPIHIHDGISNTQVYIEDGVVHVKPN